MVAGHKLVYVCSYMNANTCKAYNIYHTVVSNENKSMYNPIHKNKNNNKRNQKMHHLSFTLFGNQCGELAQQGVLT